MSKSSKILKISCFCIFPKVDFKLYRPSSNEWIDLTSNNNDEWYNFGIIIIDNMSIVSSPTSLLLTTVFPNPFNPVTNITYEVPFNEHVEVNVYNVNGALVQTLFNGSHNKGVYNVQWDASYYSSGIYFLRMSAHSLVNDSNKRLIRTQKLMLVK